MVQKKGKAILTENAKVKEIVNSPGSGKLFSKAAQWFYKPVNLTL
jgi:hypothetical protein